MLWFDRVKKTRKQDSRRINAVIVQLDINSKAKTLKSERFHSSLFEE